MTVKKKIILLIIGISLLLLLVPAGLSLLLQLPGIQNFVVHRTIDQVNKRMEGSIALSRIGIALPGSIVLEDLLVRDSSNDTIISASKIRVRLKLIGLLRRQAHFRSVRLSDCSVNIIRNDGEKKLNIQKLLPSRPSVGPARHEKKAGGKGFTIDVRRVRLDKVRFLLDDRESGVRVETSVGNLAIRMDRFDLDSLAFGIRDLELDDAWCGVGIFTKGKPSPDSGNPVRLPRITLGTLRISNSAFAFEDTIAGSTIDVDAGEIEIEKGDVNLDGQVISVHSVVVKKAEVDLGLTDAKERPGTIAARDSAHKDENRWRISADRLDLSKSRFALDVVNAPRRKPGFDAAHMQYQGIAVKAFNVFYSAKEIRAKLAHAAATDPNTVDLKKCAVDFSMDENGIAARDLIVTTVSSDIRASCSTGFSPFNVNRRLLADLPVTAVFKPSKVSTKDVGAFVPALAGTPGFKGDERIITLSGAVTGPVKSLKGENIRVTYGDMTSVQTGFRVRGLPEPNRVAFDIPAITLVTGRGDVESLLGKEFLPRDLTLPSEIRLDASFIGTMKAFQSTLRTTLDKSVISATVSLDSTNRYVTAIEVSDLNPGLIYRGAKPFGAMTFKATVDGRGFDLNTLTARVRLNAASLHFNKYTYRSLTADVRVDSQRYQGTVSLQDDNLSLSLDGDLMVAKDREHIRCKVGLKQADLHALRLIKDTLSVSARIEADLKGGNLAALSGRLAMTDFSLVKSGTVYRLDSLVAAITTSAQGRTLDIHSPALEVRYKGADPLDKAVTGLGRLVLNALPFLNGKADSIHAPDLGDMTLDIAVHNHPLLNGLLLPELTLLEEVRVRVGYVEKEQKLTAEAGVERSEYKGILSSGVHARVMVEENRLAYTLTAKEITHARAGIFEVDLRGTSAGEKATLTVMVNGENLDSAVYATLSARTSDSGLILTLDPSRFYLGGHPWTVSRDNYVRVKDRRVTVRDFSLSRDNAGVTVSSATSAARDDLSITVENIGLGSLSRTIAIDSTFIDGMLHAKFNLRREGDSSFMGVTADLRDLQVQNVNLGSLSLKAENPDKGKYQVVANLTGQENNARIEGSFATGPAAPVIDIVADIRNLSLKSIEPFTAKAISGSRGVLQGTFAYKLEGKKPLMNGTLHFRDASFIPAALNSTIRLGEEAIEIKNAGVFFNRFSIRDRQNHLARLSGVIIADSAGLFRFDLRANADNFLLLSTDERINPVFYGRLIVDWQAVIRGTSRLPDIDSRVVVKSPSSLTFAVPEAGAKNDRGEDIVVFAGRDTASVNDRSAAGKKKKNGTFRGIDLTSEIEINQGVTLRLIPDPSTQDALVARGDAALNFGLDKSGKMSLTGTYRLSDGSYTVTLPPLQQKKFTIRSGSTLMWNGDPANANAAIVAQYAVSAAPIDLVVGQVPSEEHNRYRKPLQFEVVLHFNGPLRKPDISFGLDLAPADKGELGGMIDARLAQINQDPTALNKQVFALLVLGKFIPENPLDQAGGIQLASVARSSVSGFLSAQLNQWGSSLLPGFQFNIGLQSWDNIDSGQTVGKTMVDLGVKKQLFNERLSVEVGGVFDVQGDKDNQNAAKDFGGNVAVEYKLTADGRYSLKGFRQMQYEGALDGQLTKTGVGVVYSRNFDFWRHLFRKPGKGGKDRDDE
ncbi:MAG: translocation/assembly module TamB [Chitinispirillaceae bacterium]|nr:translocation/assembly module TamB [Chitinispirillaceae bacterium]